GKWRVRIGLLAPPFPTRFPGSRRAIIVTPIASAFLPIGPLATIGALPTLRTLAIATARAIRCLALPAPVTAMAARLLAPLWSSCPRHGRRLLGRRRLCGFLFTCCPMMTAWSAFFGSTGTPDVDELLLFARALPIGRRCRGTGGGGG